MRIALLSVLLASSAAWAGLSASPMLIEKAVTPEDNEIEFVLSNSTDQDMLIAFRTGPLQHDRSGSPIAGSRDYPFDVSSRIHFDNPLLTLKARKWHRVRAHVDVPNRPGGGYAFIYARSQPNEATAGTVVSSLEVGIVVELTFPNPGVRSIAVEDLVSDKKGLRVAIANKGDSHVKPAGRIDLLNNAGSVVWSTALVPANVFPRLTRELKVADTLPKLAPGRYVARISVEGTPAPLERNLALVDGQLLVERPRKPRPK